MNGGSGSGADGEGGDLGVGEAHAFGQDDAESFEQRRLSGVGLRHAAQADLAVRGGGQDHVLGLDACEFLEHGARGVTQGAFLLPQLERLPQHEGQEAHQDVGLNTVGALMPDWTHAQLILLNAKCRFGLRELDVGFPELRIAPVGDVGTQQVGAFGYFGPLIEGCVVRDMQMKACGATALVNGGVEPRDFGGGARFSAA